MKPFKFRCPHCDKRYKLEHHFEQHTCPEKERTDHLATIEGTRAYKYYQEWNNVQGRRVPDKASFITSNTYKAFVNFEKFIRKVQLPSTSIYIKLMVENTLQPSQWMTDIAYAHYINHLDKRATANDQANITVDTIFDYCDDHDAQTSEFFDIVPTPVFIKMILRRKLSPWILLNSKKFREYYRTNLNSDQRKIFENIHPPSVWKERLETKKSTVRNMKEVVRELSI